ncbi:hypothetical protein QFZ53_002848 [Microbacterium natoriense]|uniref:Uncharacterized protein n=2 Tax=Microbacterium natoriense TaxID=284570 RepID=A0AAW8EZH2_9MICO|nr:hypothetical protein [Microbacterium natoriense]
MRFTLTTMDPGRIVAMSSHHLPEPESEYGYTLRQVKAIVGTELMPEFREHMMMRAHVLDGPDGEVFYPFDVLQFVERTSRRLP